MFGGFQLNKQSIGVLVGALGGFAACWIVVGMAGCGRGGDVIATVNGESITADDFYKYLEFKPEVRVVTQSGVATLQPEGTLGFQALQDLISQKVTMQLARDKNVYPTDADVNKELEFKKKLNPDFLPRLTASGFTFDLIRQSITLDLIRERLLTDGIKVTSADVEKYIKDNSQEFIDPEKVDLYWVLVQDKPTQKRVDEELNAGQAFSQVAIKYSAAPDAKETGAKLVDKTNPRVPPALKSLPQNVQQAIKNLREGQKTDWIMLVDGYAMFMLNKRIPERAMVMDDTKKEYLRRLLAQKKGSEARDINRQVLQKLKDSKVDVQRTSFQAPWKEAYRKFMVENKLDAMTGTRAGE